MPIIIDNKNASELQKKSVTAGFDAIIPYLVKYVKSTNFMLSHYLLIDCVIGTSASENIEIRYIGKDEDGVTWKLSIEILDGELKMTNTKLCNGIEILNGRFKYLPISPEKAYSQFYSAVNLFLTDLGAWCSEHNISLDLIRFDPKEDRYAFKDIKEQPNGEYRLYFEHTGVYEF